MRLNVMSVANVDAQNLVLTTNGPGNGATSVDGELNIQNLNFTWVSLAAEPGQRDQLWGYPVAERGTIYCHIQQLIRSYPARRKHRPPAHWSKSPVILMSWPMIR